MLLYLASGQADDEEEAVHCVCITASHRHCIWRPQAEQEVVLVKELCLHSSSS